MNIIKVIVDELPRSASSCPATDRFWPGFDEVKDVTCKFTGVVQMNVFEFFSERRPNCPLVEAEKEREE
jgi:hypothetical protein